MSDLDHYLESLTPEEQERARRILEIMLKNPPGRYVWNLRCNTCGEPSVVRASIEIEEGQPVYRHCRRCGSVKVHRQDRKLRTKR